VTAGGPNSPLWKAAQHYGLIGKDGKFNEGADLAAVRGRLNSEVGSKTKDISSSVEANKITGLTAQARQTRQRCRRLRCLE